MATPAQVYQQILADGGTLEQAQVGAALVSGVESDGDPTELSGGVGPAAGLFQYEPGTWAGQGGTAYAPVAQDATWQQQVEVFVHGTQGNNFGAWGPDLVANSGDPNSSSNPAYGYTGGPQAGSRVGNVIAQNASAWAGAPVSADLTAADTTGSASGTGTPATTAGGGQAGAPYTPSDVPGIPESAPSFPDFTANPYNEISRVLSWTTEFAGWALFVILIFFLGMTLFLIGIVLLIAILAGPAVTPVIGAVGKSSPTGREVGGVAATFGGKKKSPSTPRSGGAGKAFAGAGKTVPAAGRVAKRGTTGNPTDDYDAGVRAGMARKSSGPVTKAARDRHMRDRGIYVEGSNTSNKRSIRPLADRDRSGDTPF